jgi:hypothetical protein
LLIAAGQLSQIEFVHCDRNFLLDECTDAVRVRISICSPLYNIMACAAEAPIANHRYFLSQKCSAFEESDSCVLKALRCEEGAPG